MLVTPIKFCVSIHSTEEYMFACFKKKEHAKQYVELVSAAYGGKNPDFESLSNKLMH